MVRPAPKISDTRRPAVEYRQSGRTARASSVTGTSKAPVQQTRASAPCISGTGVRDREDHARFFLNQKSLPGKISVRCVPTKFNCRELRDVTKSRVDYLRFDRPRCCVRRAPARRAAASDPGGAALTQLDAIDFRTDGGSCRDMCAYSGNVASINLRANRRSAVFASITLGPTLIAQP